MQPRQRSKWPTTVGLSEIVPSRCDSISWIRPRGESISSLQSRYVGHVGRQKPQWTQSLVSERRTSGAVVTRALPAGSKRSRTRSWSRRTGSGVASAHGVGEVGDARGRPDDGGRGARRGTPAARRARTTSARAPRPGASATRPRPRRPSRSPPTSDAGRRDLRRDGGGAALEQHCDAAGVEDVERARDELGGEQRRGDRRRVVRLDDDRRRGGHGVGMEAQADPADEREPAARAADELAEVVAGDVLDDLAAGVDDRAVGEHERDAEHEVARRAEAVAQRAREILGEAGADRRVAGRVEREALAGRGRARPRGPRGGSLPRRCR